MSNEVFGSPTTYVQGKDLLFQSKDYLASLGNRVLVLAGKDVLKLVGNRFEDYLSNNGFEVTSVEFNGESSMTEIKRVAELGNQNNVQLIIGLGGGKTLDTAKAIADELGVKVAILPTLASTDAPCSRLSVIYHDNGSFSNYLFYSHNPELVLVDTRVIAGAPKRFLVAGLGDALATNIEAQAIAKGNGKTMLNAKQTLVGNAIATKCEETLFNYGLQAIQSVEGKVDSKALDKITEANILMSGLGFESGGLAAAHAIYNGTTVLGNQIHKMHGEIVAFGALAQLYLEGADQKRYDRFLNFELSVGLPTTFEDLGIKDIRDEQLLSVAHAANSENDTMGNMPFSVSDDDIVQAMKGANDYNVHYQALNK